MLGSLKLAKRWLAVPLVLMVVIGLAVFSPRLASGNEPNDKTIASGGGTTIIHGGTGPSQGFLPVLTTIAFHAEGTAGSVTGSFECLALAPEVGTGSKSAQFTVNAMYVTGQITGATVHGDTATLTGTSVVTGLGAGLDLPFTFVVQKGGPGATSVLTVNGLTFNEILVEGSFQVQTNP
ncbi:MAG: hypothetical protein DMG30_25735 [Acidobacteria bacterium]|nr:MAG: hypothetical protein DMG30_25735 [Acidobacteriota bacterium]